MANFTAEDLEIDPFDEVRIIVGGSSAYDNIRLRDSQVPAPGGILLLAIGLGGLAASRRRSRG